MAVAALEGRIVPPINKIIEAIDAEIQRLQAALLAGGVNAPTWGKVGQTGCSPQSVRARRGILPCPKKGFKGFRQEMVLFLCKTPLLGAFVLFCSTELAQEVLCSASP